MPSVDPGPLSGRYLSFSEREEIAILKAQGVGVREIARRWGASPSTISRELRRNAATRSGRFEYRASVGAVEGRAARPAPQDGEAGRRPEVARVCAAAARRGSCASGRNAGGGAGHGAVEGPQQAAPPGPQVGHGLEPAADL